MGNVDEAKGAMGWGGWEGCMDAEGVWRAGGVVAFKHTAGLGLVCNYSFLELRMLGQCVTCEKTMRSTH